MTGEVAEPSAFKAALETMATMQTVERLGPAGIETVRVADLTDEERALLLAMLSYSSSAEDVVMVKVVHSEVVSWR